jgi:capsular polysaccharide biosynthesis protein
MEEIDLKEIFIMFWNKRVQLLLIVAAFFIIGFVYTMGFVTPEYTSSTTLVLAQINSEKTTDAITASDITLNSKLVSTYSELIKSKKVLREVISNLGINVKEETLRNGITVNAVKNTELIKITVTNKNAEVSAKVANEIAKVFEKQVAEIYNINNVHVVDEAEVATAPSNINHTNDILMFIAIGIVVAVAYVFMLNMLDTTIKSVEEVEKLLDLPVIASIPMWVFEKGGKK